MTQDDSRFQQAMLASQAHERDVSFRDGNQSWDANKWPIPNLLACLEQLRQLARVVKDLGGRFNPAELWGGGQVLNPAKFIGEDPLRNLEAIAVAVGPDIDLQCLYRGRQCFGYRPVSAQVQEEVINAVADRGMKVFRIFDMMNDPQNLVAGFNAVKKYHDTHADDPAKKNIVIEGAISYISEPPGKPRVWALKDYADYAVTLAGMGADEVVIKNYAGVGNKDIEGLSRSEMPKLVAAVRDALNKNGYEKVPVNLHTHGRHPEILADAIKAGADKVDVAFGALSDGPSHTNGVDLLKLLMKRQGFEVDGEYKQRFDHHPIVVQMRKLEKVIDEQLKLTGLDRARPPEIPQEKLEHYRMAGGAIGEVWSNRASKADPDFYEMYRRQNVKKYAVDEKTLPALPQTPRIGELSPDEKFDNDEARAAAAEQRRKTELPMREEFGSEAEFKAAKEAAGKLFRARRAKGLEPFQREIFDKILEAGPALWEKAGRFNTVTPGALILSVQAQQIVQNRLTGVPVSMQDYTEPYMDVVAGRYGKNKGAEKLEDAKKFRNAVLAFRTLRRLNAASDEDPEFARELLQSIALNSRARLKVSWQPKGEITVPRVNLDDPDLEQTLSGVDIEAFRNAIAMAKDTKGWKGENSPRAKLRAAMIQEATPGRFDEPQEGRETGEAIIRSIEQRQGRTMGELRNAGARISPRDDMVLLALTLRSYDKFGKLDDSIINDMVKVSAAKASAHLPAEDRAIGARGV